MADKGAIERIYNGVLGKIEKHYVDHRGGALRVTLGQGDRFLVIPTWADESGERLFGFHQRHHFAAAERLISFLDGNSTAHSEDDVEDAASVVVSEYLRPDDTFTLEYAGSFHLDPDDITNVVSVWTAHVSPAEGVTDALRWLPLDELHDALSEEIAPSGLTLAASQILALNFPPTS